MPKKKNKQRKPSPRTRVGQNRAHADRDVVGISNHRGDINYFYADAAPQGAASMAAALPPVEAGFTGREEDLERLLAALDPANAEGTAAVSVVGMGGVGKTQLALTAAHQTLGQGWFSQALFLDLRGYTTPVNAHRALQSLLHSLGVEAERIPEDGDARAGLYRATLAARGQEWGGPVLVVADNASTPDQVTPLEPGPGGHRLLATSRERLGGLPARRVDVGVLNDAEAFRVLATDLRLTDPDDERAHDVEGLTQVAKACAGLPLALRIAAGQLKNAPDLEPEPLAHALTQGADRITRFTDHRELGAVFDTSLARLPAEQQDLLTLLGMLPGPDISTTAAAVLAGTDETTVVARLRGLSSSHLLTGSKGRWEMHDLVASYATTLAGPRPASRLTRARRRLLDYYTDHVTAAAQHLQALPGDDPPEAFADREEALGWLDAQRAVLINTAHLAHQTGHIRATIELPLKLREYLDMRRLFRDQNTITRLALETAQRIGDRLNEAAAWNNLGLALYEVRRFDEAIEAHTRARNISQQLGDAHREAGSWGNLGLVLCEMGRCDEAIDAHTRARNISQQLGDAHTEAMAWNNLGLALRETGRCDEAIDAHTHARNTFHLLGDAHGEAVAYAGVGTSLGRIQRWEEATVILEWSVEFFAEQHDQHSHGQACYELGLVHYRSGCPDQAIPLLEQAVELLAATNDPHMHAQARQALDEAAT
ncbi:MULTISPECIES: tetratricopeptide repeat protein [Nocardiopsis]|uniref:Orc1-like AAA ATPase domain-containing protein n=1 Tax=Nocardiopsis sinuspersici TaxID=501010 RepID=A0A1V3BVG7_9ACTN|nr:MULTISPECIES: tetratricopeptide repeat protein [Nocardiopsis]OOC52495.1 hypothetical protein NOSIN_00470 [Nocardiopsis sinuspersici]